MRFFNLKKPSVSLASQLFLGLAATAFLVVVIMATMVAVNMRAGFSRYLLQGEIVRFDGLVQALGDLAMKGPNTWDQFSSDHAAWKAFVAENFHPIGSSAEANQPPPAPWDGLGKPPGDPLQISDRLYLLRPDESVVVQSADQGGISVTRPIYSPDHRDLFGFLGLRPPGPVMGNIDEFFLRGQYQNLALAAVLAVVLSAVAAFILARGLLAPIKALELGARTLSSGQYNLRIPNQRRDELGDLIDHYNVLAENLEAAEHAQRQWVSNTSHELQTPLAILRAEIEALQDGVRQPDKKTLGEIHGAVMRLSKLVQDLKVLSLNGEGQVIRSLVSTDLSRIAKEAADTMGARALVAGLQLSCAFASELVVQCDADRMRQVIDNVLENSVRYTNAPGEVVVTGKSGQGFVALLIDDTSPAPLAQSVPHLFERFYRDEQSRSRSAGGSGLGLAICQAIVHAHGGTIRAELSPKGGLRIEIRLPVRG